MILKRLLLEPQANSDAGGSNNPPPPAKVETTVQTEQLKVAAAPKHTLTPAKERKPTEAELKVNFSVEDLPEVNEGSRVTTLKKEPEEKTEEVKTEVKPEAKKEEIKTEVKTTAEVKPLMPPSKTAKTEEPPARDYTGFTPEEQVVLKQMSNPAFEYTTKLLKRTKELENSGAAAAFYQHPQGYVLDPAFNKMQQDAHFTQKEANYWQEQLALINAGEKWRPIVGWNEDGSPKVGEERKPTSDDAERVRLAVGQCMNIGQQQRAQVQAYAQQHNQRVQQDSAAIQTEQAKRFGWVADPKLLDEKMNVEGVGEKSIRQIREDFLNLLPPYHRNTVTADLSANLFVAIQILNGRLREAEAGKQIAEVKRQEATRVEPTSTTRPKVEEKKFNGVSTFTLEDLPT